MFSHVRRRTNESRMTSLDRRKNGDIVEPEYVCGVPAYHHSTRVILDHLLLLLFFPRIGHTLIYLMALWTSRAKPLEVLTGLADRECTPTMMHT